MEIIWITSSGPGSSVVIKWLTILTWQRSPLAWAGRGGEGSRAYPQLTEGEDGRMEQTACYSINVNYFSCEKWIVVSQRNGVSWRNLVLHCQLEQLELLSIPTSNFKSFYDLKKTVKVVASALVPCSADSDKSQTHGERPKETQRRHRCCIFNYDVITFMIPEWMESRAADSGSHTESNRDG